MTDKTTPDEHNDNRDVDLNASSSTLTRGYLNLNSEGITNPKVRSIASLAAMPVILHVRIPLPAFKLHSLATLTSGSVVTTGWPSSEDLPVTAGDVRLAWAEFAIADHKRSVRVTRIS